MQKFILSCCVCALLHLSSFSQDARQNPVQKNKLPLLQGMAKVDSLNKIAYSYLEFGILQPDSGIVYARQAFDLAEKINYSSGLCIASNQYAKLLLQLSRPVEGLKYYKLTVQLGHETKNDSLAALGLRGMGQALWYQGYFQEAIDTIISSIRYFQKLGFNWEISDATLIISNIYGNQGNFEKAFEWAQQALKLSTKLKDTANMVLSLVQLGYLYKNLGDNSTALDYYKKAYDYKSSTRQWPYRYLSICMGELYADQKLYDSAWYFYQQSLRGNPQSKASKLRLARFFLAKKNYDSALFYFRELYNVLKKGGEGHISLYSGLGMAQIYLDKKDFKNAERYAQEALQTATEKNAKLVIRDACLLLSSVYHEMNLPDRAFAYLTQYVQMNDSVITDKFKGKLFEFRRIAEVERKQSQIELLNKERLISEQNLKQTRFLRNILIGGILFVILLGFIVFWNISLKRKNENLRNESLRMEWQHTAVDLEMQALRARMNPHFIFNCLSSINRFIIMNEPDKASDYLTRFSRLMRLVLINSQKPLVSLEEEVEMLRLYVEMERLRFKNSFDYSITYTNELNTSNTMIPPLLLQPFCENAIWHGLMHKEGHGELSIGFAMRNEILYCTIVDDGIGRARAAELKSGSGENQKSFGLKLTTARLALFNEDSSMQTSYDIEDVMDEQGNIAGTKVILKIRYKEFVTQTI